ncbi:MAG: ABC transporter ATP-binding protein [Fimbriimonadales bacterium]|nr:ABC transporter ATP-binding protein [Fimbriimonadales bacterium]
MLEIRGLDVSYGAIRALREVDLDVNAGEIVAIVGSNGAGKSTLLRTISGLVRPRAGKIVFESRPIVGFKPHRIVAMGISHVPEGRRIFTDLTVWENLALAAQFRKPSTFDQDLETVCRWFPRIRERLKQSAGTLSGGEQQMLAIGRAIMARPKLLLLDEPSLGLAPNLVKEIFRILQDINRAGTTVCLVEQNAHMALEVAHRAYVLETGQVALSGPGRELLDDPRVQAAYLGG